jgi:multidrug efflux pump subunit AcrB
VRWVVLCSSMVLWVLLYFFWNMSKHELAPNEDQGVIFGIVQSAPEATL